MAYIIFYGSVSEFIGEDLEDLAAAPALFAVGVVGEVVWVHAAQVVLEVVRAGPWVAWCGYD